MLSCFLVFRYNFNIFSVIIIWGNKEFFFYDWIYILSGKYYFERNSNNFWKLIAMIIIAFIILLMESGFQQF